MTNGCALCCALGAGLLGLATFSDAAAGSSELSLSDLLRKPASHEARRVVGSQMIEGGPHYGRRAYGGAVIQLGTTDLQPLAASFAFGVSHVTFKNRQLYLIGDLVNLSAVTYGAVHLLITAEHGARQRVNVGRIAPGRSQRVQIRLTTRCDRRPGSVRLAFMQAIADYQPMPRKTERPGRFRPRGEATILQQISSDSRTVTGIGT